MPAEFEMLEAMNGDSWCIDYLQCLLDDPWSTYGDYNVAGL